MAITFHSEESISSLGSPSPTVPMVSVSVIPGKTAPVSWDGPASDGPASVEQLLVLW